MPCLNPIDLRYKIFAYKYDGTLEDLNKEFTFSWKKAWEVCPQEIGCKSTWLIMRMFFHDQFAMINMSGHQITQVSALPLDQLRIFWRQPVWLLEKIN